MVFKNQVHHCLAARISGDAVSVQWRPPGMGPIVCARTVAGEESRQGIRIVRHLSACRPGRGRAARYPTSDEKRRARGFTLGRRYSHQLASVSSARQQSPRAPPTNRRPRSAEGIGESFGHRRRLAGARPLPRVTKLPEQPHSGYPVSSAGKAADRLHGFGGQPSMQPTAMKTSIFSSRILANSL